MSVKDPVFTIVVVGYLLASIPGGLYAEAWLIEHYGPDVTRHITIACIVLATWIILGEELFSAVIVAGILATCAYLTSSSLEPHFPGLPGKVLGAVGSFSLAFASLFLRIRATGILAILAILVYPLLSLIPSVRRKWRELAEQEDERATRAERARDNARFESYVREQQQYRERMAQMPVPEPKADITDCLRTFAAEVEHEWPFARNRTEQDDDSEFSQHNWLQQQFIHHVVRVVGCPLIDYGDYDDEFDDGPEELVSATELDEYHPMQIMVNQRYYFDSLINLDENRFLHTPPYDHVLALECVPGADSMQRRYFPLTDATFTIEKSE